MSEKDLERMDEREIDIKDFLMYACIRWRMFLIWVLIGAIVLGGIGAWKAYSANRVAQQALETLSEESAQSKEKVVEELKQSLTNQEALEVERVFESYKDMVRNCESVAKYIEESVRMQLDPYAVSTISLGYFVDNHYQSVYPAVEGKDNTAATIVALQEGVLDTITYNRIIKELGWDKDEEYVRELISMRNVGDVFYISIYAPGQAECETIRDIIMERIQVRSGELQNIFGKFDVEIIENEYRVIIDRDLLSEQTSMVSNIYNYKSNYALLEAGMSESQKSYLNELKNIELQMSTKKNIDKNNEIEVPKQGLFQIKYVLLGALVGIVLYCVLLFLRYVLSEKLHTADEMEQRYCVRLLAEIDGVEARKRKKGVDKFFHDLFIREGFVQNVEDAVSAIQSEIHVLVKNANVNSFYVATTCDTLECDRVIESICEKKNEEHYSIYRGDEVSYKPEELVKIGECDGVVFVEQVGASSYKRIRRLVCFCRKNNIPIIGCAVVK